MSAGGDQTDWLAGAAGFEPLHLEIRSAELHPASTGFRRRSGAPLIRDAQVRVPPPGLRAEGPLGHAARSQSNLFWMRSTFGERHRSLSKENCLRRPPHERSWISW